jgi:predicted transcriptional regulator
MALALKERSISELLGQNDAIKALKKENELLESEKTKLSAEVVELANLRLELGGLQTEKEKVDKEVVELRKQAEDAKGAEALVVEHALKVNLLSTRLKAAEELVLTTT